MCSGRRSRIGLVPASWLASLALALTPAATQHAGAQPSPAPRGPALTVSSEPEGAAVELDGKRIGRTPVAVEHLAEGEHQIAITKKGFVDARRTLTAVAGSTSHVQVRLEAVESGDAHGGGGSKKWLLIGAGAAVAGAGVVLATRAGNEIPVVTVVSVEPADVVGLASATELTFSVQATDPDGDTLTYAWDFGDGQTGAGQRATHTYAQAGSYTAGVTVSDGEDSATGSAAVEVRSLAGRWRGSVLGFTFAVDLRQNGASLVGSWSFPDFGELSPITGRVVVPRGLELRATNACERLEGTLSSDADVIRGTVGCGTPEVPFHLRRE